ncbi:MAG: DUF3313 domain-containing protein [Myxococcota bacterium]
MRTGFRSRILLALGFILLFTACQTTRQAHHVDRAGFLGDYSMLREGEGDEALLTYVDRTVDFRRYDAVVIDTVTFWHSGESKVSPEDQQMLTDALYHSLHTKMVEHGVKVVMEPGPGVLRVRAAITEAKGARVVGNALTSIIPQTRLLATLTGLATDTAVFVGKASVEMDVRDSVTDQRVAAAVDERIGTKAVRGAFTKWGEVKDAFDYWADRAATRLQELRGVEKED